MSSPSPTVTSGEESVPTPLPLAWGRRSEALPSRGTELRGPCKSRVSSAQVARLTRTLDPGSAAQTLTLSASQGCPPGGCALQISMPTVWAAWRAEPLAPGQKPPGTHQPAAPSGPFSPSRPPSSVDGHCPARPRAPGGGFPVPGAGLRLTDELFGPAGAQTPPEARSGDSCPPWTARAPRTRNLSESALLWPEEGCSLPCRRSARPPCALPPPASRAGKPGAGAEVKASPGTGRSAVTSRTGALQGTGGGAALTGC